MTSGVRVTVLSTALDKSCQGGFLVPQLNFLPYPASILRKDIRRKKSFTLRHCPNYARMSNLPPSSWANLVLLFTDVKTTFGAYDRTGLQKLRRQKLEVKKHRFHFIKFNPMTLITFTVATFHLVFIILHANRRC